MLNCPQNVLKCNKIVHPAQLTCIVVISCVSGAFIHLFVYTSAAKSHSNAPETQEITTQVQVEQNELSVLPISVHFVTI